MFLDGQKLHPYIPMAEARGFTGAVDKRVLLPFIAVGTGMVNHNKAIKVYFDILNNSDILFIVCDKNAKLIEEFKNYFKLNS